MNSITSTWWRSRVTTIILIGAVIIGGLGCETPMASAVRNEKSARKVQAFSNTTAIAIPSNRMAIPSSIVVSGFKTTIADVDVSLNVLSHPAASNLDIMLVGPGGQMTLLMSDAGGGAANDSLSFSDQAADQLPSSSALVGGIFQPTNYDFTSAPDKFASPPAPVSTAPSGSALAVFNGSNPNGIWTLYISEQDNAPVEIGSLGTGWSLRITTANGVPETNADHFPVQAGRELNVPAMGVLQNDRDPDEDLLSATLAGSPRQGRVTLQPDGSFIYRSKKKAKGNDSFTYLATDTTGLTALETVTIQIKGSKNRTRK